MMRKFYQLLNPAFLFLPLIILLTAQRVEGQGNERGELKGKLLDSLSSAPLALANIQVYHSGGTRPVAGVTSAISGDFSVALDFGTYYALVEHIGYRSFRTPA